MITGKHVILSGVLLAAAAICAETPPKTGTATVSNVPPVILVGFSEDRAGEAERVGNPHDRGALMRGFCVFEESKWRAIDPMELPSLVPVSTPFVSLWDPAASCKMSRVVNRPCLCCASSPENHLLLLPKHKPPVTQVLVSQVGWQSVPKPISSATKDLEELIHGMRLEMQEKEDEVWARGIKERDCDEDCRRNPLHARESKEVYEFELTPGEPAYFVAILRQYEAKNCCGLALSSGRCSIVRKDGQASLLGQSWVLMTEEVVGQCDRLCGVADINGDGVTELIISEYGDQQTYTLYEYRDNDLMPVLYLSCSP